MADRTKARELAKEFAQRGDPTGWFEALYASANGKPDTIPWADLKPNSNLTAWLDTGALPMRGSALTIGCGLGDDAEELSRRGWNVTAFDISPTAIEWCRRRFPNSTVQYSVADVRNPPAQWNRAFDFVFESYTLQVLPKDVRSQAIRNVGDLVSPGGTLLVICRGREPNESEGAMPWPLLRSELRVLLIDGRLTEISFEDYFDPDDISVRRFRCVFREGK